MSEFKVVVKPLESIFAVPFVGGQRWAALIAGEQNSILTSLIVRARCRKLMAHVDVASSPRFIPTTALSKDHLPYHRICAVAVCVSGPAPYQLATLRWQAVRQEPVAAPA